jgi:hypothetical protein
MVAWQSNSSGDDILMRNGAAIACVKPSAELVGLWRVIRPKVIAGEHERSAARALAARLCGIAKKDLVQETAT